MPFIASLKPRVAKTICRIDRKTQAVTAGQSNPFENVPAEIEGFGSEKLDYTFYVRLDSLGEIRMTCENLVAYSEDYMKGRATTPSADVTASQAYIKICECQNVTYTSLAEVKITGYIGNKRHISVFHTYHDGSTVVQKTSYYTADTSTELKSFQFYSPVNDTLTYSIAGTAVPKVQYNPNAILLKNLNLTNQTTDIVFGGDNNAGGVDKLDGDLYKYFLCSSGLTDVVNVYVNEVQTANKTLQRIYNSGGSIGSQNFADQIGPDCSLFADDYAYINADVGRKKITVASSSGYVGLEQAEMYNTNPDSSTKLTSLLLKPNASVSGNVQLYAVLKGHNADLTPWTFQKVVDINGDFSAGHSFEIPDWALFMKVDFVGEVSTATHLMLDMNSASVAIDRQDLTSNSTNSTAGFTTVSALIYADKVTHGEAVIALKNGANRPLLSKSVYYESKMRIQSSCIKDSSTKATSAQIYGNNTNTVTGKLTVSFY